jgi:hypothetical protein
MRAVGGERKAATRIIPVPPQGRTRSAPSSWRIGAGRSRLTIKARVKVHLYADGSHAVFHGPRCIGRYDKNGTIRDAKNAA